MATPLLWAWIPDVFFLPPLLPIHHHPPGKEASQTLVFLSCPGECLHPDFMYGGTMGLVEGLSAFSPAEGSMSCWEREELSCRMGISWGVLSSVQAGHAHLAQGPVEGGHPSQWGSLGTCRDPTPTPSHQSSSTG